MNTSSIRRIDLSLDRVIIYLSIIFAIIFLVICGILVGTSTNSLATITCDEGDHAFIIPDETDYEFFVVNVKMDYGPSCQDYEPLTQENTTILIFSLENDKIYDSNWHGSIRLKIQRRYIRIHIIHSGFSDESRSYEVTVKVKYFKTSSSVKINFYVCGSLYILSILSTFIIFMIKKVEGVRDTSYESPTIVQELTFNEEKVVLSRADHLLGSNLLRAKFEQIPTKAICMISKTTFEKDDEIIQCKNCLSYFLMDYILKWLKKNNSCPVCQVKIE